MIITLTGLPGAGKSTIKKLLAEALGLKAYSVGDMRGKMAAERGMTIDEFNALGMTEDFTDKDADTFQKNLGKTEDNFVIDGRLSWHFIPESIKIFLQVDADVAAQRIYQDRKKGGGRSDEPEYTSPEEAKRIIAERVESDRARYQKWYGLDFFDLKNYDLVIDTTHRAPEEILKEILNFIKSR